MVAAGELTMALGALIRGLWDPDERRVLLAAIFGRANAVAGMLRAVSCPNAPPCVHALLCSILFCMGGYTNFSCSGCEQSRVLRAMPGALIKSAAASIARTIALLPPPAGKPPNSRHNKGAFSWQHHTATLLVALTVLCDQTAAWLAVSQQPGFLSALLWQLPMQGTHPLGTLASLQVNPAFAHVAAHSGIQESVE